MGGTKQLHAQKSMSRPIHSLVQICVIKDDVWALPTKLKSNRLQIALRSSLHYLPPDESAAGECDFLNFQVRGNCGAYGRAIASDNVDGARREAGFLNELAHAKGGQGREFGRLGEM
jgi:hypothetical protein